MGDDAIDDDLSASVPAEMKGLRACIPCMLVKTFHQFYEQGCENCTFLGLQEDRERCNEVTTANFQGLVAVMDPKQSWVARWLRVAKLVPGCYAIKVDGEVDETIEQELEDNGFPNLGKMSQEE